MKFASKYFTPSQLSKAYLFGGIITVFGLMVLIMEMLEPEVKERKPKPEVENVITAKKPRQFGIDAVNDKVVGVVKTTQNQSKIIEDLQKHNLQLQKELDEQKRYNKQKDSLDKKVKGLEKKIAELSQQQTQQASKASEFEKVLSKQGNLNSSSGTATKHPELKVNPERRKVAGTGFSYGSGKSTNTAQSDHRGQSTSETSNSSQRTDYRTGSLIAVIEDKEEITEGTTQKSSEIRIPKGSILTGVLITGLDAPTAASAKDSPVPVLVRIKKEAILPNYATVMEVRECFAIMAGYGDLSSERAMIRGESITCVRHDKTIIEADFSGFAVGEDGKNGLKGTLVTRNSTLLANSMMAGFAAGMAKMFDVNPVPVLSTDTTGQQQYQSVFSTDALSGGAAKGASEAMTRLADYYLKLADQIHPIIEVGAGRVIDMVVTEGMGL